MIQSKIEQGKIIFSCGCKWPVLQEEPLWVDFDSSLASRTCTATWEMLSKGLTVGIFQVETNLGKTWTRKLAPECLEHFIALCSLLRPSCLKVKDETGTSMTEHYCLRKNNLEESEPFHPLLRDILKKTFFVMCYQEQALQIAKYVAGFDLNKASRLRHAISKKKAEEMAIIEKEFIQAAVIHSQITEEEAAQIFGYVKQSQRYAFNRSISPETLVETKEGIKTIANLQIGDFVKSPKNQSEDEFVEVIDKFDHGIQEVYEITLESGKTIQCTLEHKFLCEDGKILPLREILKVNHKIMTNGV